MKYSVYRETFFSAAHHLRNYRGKCENVHGHNWRVRVFVSADCLDGDGFVVDFKTLDQVINEIADTLDHQDVNTIPPFDHLNPTAENIALYILTEADRMMRKLDERLLVSRVMVWESDKSCAIVEV